MCETQSLLCVRGKHLKQTPKPSVGYQTPISRAMYVLLYLVLATQVADLSFDPHDGRLAAPWALALLVQLHILREPQRCRAKNTGSHRDEHKGMENYFDQHCRPRSASGTPHRQMFAGQRTGDCDVRMSQRMYSRRGSYRAVLISVVFRATRLSRVHPCFKTSSHR